MPVYDKRARRIHGHYQAGATPGCASHRPHRGRDVARDLCRHAAGPGAARHVGAAADRVLGRVPAQPRRRRLGGAAAASAQRRGAHRRLRQLRAAARRRLGLWRRGLYALCRARGTGRGRRPAAPAGAVRATRRLRSSLSADLGGACQSRALLLRAARRQARAAPADPGRRRAGRVHRLWLEGSARRHRARGAQRRRRLIAPALTNAKPVAAFNAGSSKGWRLATGQGRWMLADLAAGGCAMSRAAALPILQSIGVNDENSLLHRYVKYWLLYQIVPVPMLLVGWYTLRVGGAAHQWFWPLVLSVDGLLSFACAFQAALFHGRGR